MKFKLNLPFLKLDLENANTKQITELRKLLGEVNRISLLDLEQEAFEELMPQFPFWKVSKEIQKNDKFMNVINEVSQLEDGVIVRKSSVENINEITDQGTTTRINEDEMKKRVSQIFYDVDNTKVNFALIHIMGDIPEEEFMVINDQVRKHIPNAKIEMMKTKKEVLGKTLVECVLFGPLPQEEM